MHKSSMFLSILALCFALFAASTADARGNQPCSRGKGGVKACTANGKFLCNNGSISASKRKCSR